jgi:Na+-transporting methylmalonyl-CoA/oxaloacetate decarboxylase gamma subunit
MCYCCFLFFCFLFAVCSFDCLFVFLLLYLLAVVVFDIGQLEEDRLAAIAKAKRDAEEAEERRIQAIKDAERAEIEAYLEAYRELHRIRGMHWSFCFFIRILYEFFALSCM